MPVLQYVQDTSGTFSGVGGDGVIDEGTDGRTELNVGDTVTYNGGPVFAVDVDDTTNNLLQEVDAGQTFAADTVIGGTTYPAGTQISNLDAGVFEDADGNQYTLYLGRIGPGGGGAQTVDFYIWERPGPPPPGTQLTLVSETAVLPTYEQLACFVSGTLIDTQSGPRPVETLAPGDMIWCDDGVHRPLLRRLSTSVSAARMRDDDTLRPIRIGAGALGHGLPQQDLMVSRQHRFLVRSKIAQRMFGESDILLPALRLLDLPGVRCEGAVGATYYHLLMDGHRIIRANGALTESLFLGTQFLSSVPEALHQELTALFPDLLRPSFQATPARINPTAPRQRRLISRHLKNTKPLFCPAPGDI